MHTHVANFSFFTAVCFTINYIVVRWVGRAQAGAVTGCRTRVRSLLGDFGGRRAVYAGILGMEPRACSRMVWVKPSGTSEARAAANGHDLSVGVFQRASAAVSAAP